MGWKEKLVPTQPSILCEQSTLMPPHHLRMGVTVQEA